MTDTSAHSPLPDDSTATAGASNSAGATPVRAPGEDAKPPAGQDNEADDPLGDFDDGVGLAW